MYAQTDQFAATGSYDTCSTLWSLTLMELLMDRLSSERPDHEIVSTLHELYDRKIKPAYLLHKVKFHLGVDTMLRLKVLISVSGNRKPH